MAFLCHKYIVGGLVIFGYVLISKGAIKVSKHLINTHVNEIDLDYEDDFPEDKTKNNDNNIQSPVTNNSLLIAQLLSTFHKQHSRAGTDINLKCPVKNFGANNVLLWYKNSSLLSNNKIMVDKCCKLDFDKLTLLILNATVTDSGNYNCIIHPENLIHKIELNVTEFNSGTLIHLKLEFMLISCILLIYI